MTEANGAADQRPMLRLPSLFSTPISPPAWGEGPLEGFRLRVAHADPLFVAARRFVDEFLTAGEHQGASRPVLDACAALRGIVELARAELDDRARPVLEQTVRSALLATFEAAADRDDSAELALWEFPLAGGAPEASLASWLVWWAMQRPEVLRARVAGFTLEGTAIARTVEEITRDDAGGRAPVVTREGARVMYSWPDLEPLMFERAPAPEWRRGIPAALQVDLWRQLDEWIAPQARDVVGEDAPWDLVGEPEKNEEVERG